MKKRIIVLLFLLLQVGVYAQNCDNDWFLSLLEQVQKEPMKSLKDNPDALAAYEFFYRNGKIADEVTDEVLDGIKKLGNDFNRTDQAYYNAFNNNPELFNSWKFLDGSPDIRKQLHSLEGIDGLLKDELYIDAGLSFEQLQTGINTSKSKEKLIQRLKEASNEGYTAEEFLDAFKTAGREIDHKMLTKPNDMPDAFGNLNQIAQKGDLTALNTAYSARQAATTKKAKIAASELLAEARVDQIYKEGLGWKRLDVEGVPPGKQGKFDRVYAKYENNNLIELHVIEAKGGGSGLGSRVISTGKVAQQGTKEYRDDIIRLLQTKLGESDPLMKAFNDADKIGLDIEYILVKQGTNSKSDFIIKTFP